MRGFSSPNLTPYLAPDTPRARIFLPPSSSLSCSLTLLHHDSILLCHHGGFENPQGRVYKGGVVRARFLQETISLIPPET